MLGRMLLKDEDTKDFTLMCSYDGKPTSIRLHHAVLVAHSPYWRRTLIGKHRTAYHWRVKNATELEAACALLTWMYTGDYFEFKGLEAIASRLAARMEMNDLYHVLVAASSEAPK